MNTEVWKDIPGYEGLYQASSLGRIRSIDRKIISLRSNKRSVWKGRILRPCHNMSGYEMVSLSKIRGKTIQVHRLVIESFIGPKPVGMEIMHLDGNKNNNRPTNLAYGTHKQNMNHPLASNILLCGEKHPRHKLTEKDIPEIRRCITEELLSDSEIARKYNVHRGTIRPIRIGRTWKHIQVESVLRDFAREMKGEGR